MWHLPKLAKDWLATPSFNPLDMTNKNRSVLCFNLSYLFDDVRPFLSCAPWSPRDQVSYFQELFERLIDLLEAGKITPPDCKTYAFERVADAHRCALLICACLPSLSYLF